MIGQTISHYKVLEQIGGGGMGVVYRAEDTSLQRQVALKFLPPDIVNDRQAVERFKREARAAAALNHPNICAIYEVSEHEGQPFIVMELMKGQTLKEKLLRGPLKTDEVLELGIQLADALDAAHSEGIVHRDIKPANLFVTERGQAKILDFGLAKAARQKTGSESETETGSAKDLDLTKAGSTVGTVSYMSPEQALGEKVDARTDLFSLGVVLYEAVTGRQPFTGATSAAVFHQIISQAPTAPIQLNPDAPVAVEQILNKMLEKDPDLRCQTAAELRTDLKRLLRDTDSSRTTVSAANVTPAKPQRNVANWAIALTVSLAIVLAYVLLPTGAGEEAFVRFSDLNPAFTQLTSVRGPEIFPSLSPDGQTVVYQMETASSNWDLYSRRVGGQNAIPLTDSPEDDTTPRFSPDGNFVAFRSERDGGGIFVMGATGEAPRQLTTVGFNPTWSPSGEEIVFATRAVRGPVGSAGASGKLWKVAVDTATTEEILFEGTAAQPAWSPNGHRIAYWSIRGSQRDIWTIPSDGGEPLAVTDDPAVDWSPVWSPDGNYLYFSSDRGGSTNLWRVRIGEATGATLEQPEAVTTGVGNESTHLSMSADGRRLAYTSLNPTSNIQKVSIDPTTGTAVGEATFVTEGSGQFLRPDISPNGQFLALASEGVQLDLFVVGSDGSRLENITNDGYRDFFPRWSPDGNRIAFYTNRGGSHDVWTINADGGAPQQLTFQTSNAILPIWSPTGVDFQMGSRVWRWLGRHRLCRCGLFARDVRLRNRHFGDRPNRFSRDPVKYVEPALLSGLSHDLALAAVDRDVHQQRRRRNVMVPDRMVYELEMPQPFTAFQIDRNEGFGEEVVAQPIAAVLVDCRRLDRQVRDSGLGIDRDLGPHAVVAGPLPGTIFPGVVPELARTRNAVEAPQEIAALGVECTYHALRVDTVAIPQTFRHRGSDDNSVADHGGGRMETDFTHLEIHLLILADNDSQFQVDDAVPSEGWDRDTRLGIQRHHLVPDRHQDDSIVALAVGPVCEAPPGELSRRHVRPAPFIHPVHP